MGKFTLNPGWLKTQSALWEERTEALTQRIYEDSQAIVPVGKGPKRREGPFITDAQFRNLHSRRGRRALRAHRPGTLKRSGHVIEAYTDGQQIHGGVVYTAPYAFYREVGTRHMTGAHYLLKSLEAHRSEISSGEFLKGD